MADVVYDRFFSGQMAGGDDSISLTGDKIMVMLLSGSYIANQETHNHTGDVKGDEVFGTNYTGGGQELTSVTITTVGTAAARTGVLDAPDISWLASTITASGCALYKSGTISDPSSNPLIGFVDFTENKASSAGTFTVQWDAGGILHFRQGS